MMQRAPTPGQYFLAAVAGGVPGGLLFFAPVLNFLNWCCCLGIVVCGLLSGFVLSRFSSNGIRPGQGVGVGTLAGLMAGLIFAVIAGAMFMGMGGEELLRQELARSPFYDAETREMMDRFIPLLRGPLAILIIAAVVGIPCSVAGLLGGLIASAIWKPRPPAYGDQSMQPPSVPPPPPPAWPPAPPPSDPGAPPPQAPPSSPGA